MAGIMKNRNCHGQVQSKEHPQKNLVFNPIENIRLTLVRFFSESFVTPRTRNWMRSTNYVIQHFRADGGAIIAQQILRVLLTIQINKPSV